MSSEIHGSWLATVDRKNRVYFPSDLRGQYNQVLYYYIYIDPKNPDFSAWCGFFTHVLSYPIHPYRFVILLPSRPTVNDPNLAWMVNQLNSAKVDRQGRVTLPDLRRKYGENVHILGQGKIIEIWPVDEYERRMTYIAEMYKPSNKFVYDA